MDGVIGGTGGGTAATGRLAALCERWLAAESGRGRQAPSRPGALLP